MMKKVKYIQVRSNYRTLTEGKIYEIVSYDRSDILLLNDDDLYEWVYYDELEFIDVIKFRDSVIDGILK